ncbi:DUF6192 family protein [Streptomyces sp. WAC05374]|uniref:DUF6192 family protein n=1 Tax=Streptomyces sp. WAC05374 TaxID=2487420 RepID=UPI00163D167F|nr:DUF6192 family protein [Streptomyces sp. WAC05374]
MLHPVIGCCAVFFGSRQENANRWPEGRRKEGVSFTVHRILSSVADEDERWAALEEAPFNPRTGARQWTPDGAKPVVGQRVDRPVTVDGKVQAVADLTRDDEVTAQVATDLLKRPGGLRSRTLQPPAEQYRAGPDAQQPAGQEGVPHVGPRQNQTPERGARRDSPAGTAIVREAVTGAWNSLSR